MKTTGIKRVHVPIGDLVTGSTVERVVVYSDKLGIRTLYQGKPLSTKTVK